MPAPLPPATFASRETVRLARELVGRVLVVQGADGSCTRRRIVETEAYDGPTDLACHASRGRTARTNVLFGPAGHWYVYLCYGIHEMLNLVTGPEDYPAALLIRGVEGLIGPGRLTRALGIDRRFNTRVAAPPTGLWLEEPDEPLAAGQILATPRIGVDYAGPEWAGKPWRFVWQAHDAAPTASPRRPALRRQQSG